MSIILTKTKTKCSEELCPDGWEDGGDGGLGHCYIFLDCRDTFENAQNMWVSGLMFVMLPCECGAFLMLVLRQKIRAS